MKLEVQMSFQGFHSQECIFCLRKLSKEFDHDQRLVKKTQQTK